MHKQENAKRHEGKQHRNKTQMEKKLAECDHVKKKAEKQRSRILKYMKVKIYEESYTHEDGHVGRNM
jgi:hypothetical protein